MKYSLRSLMIVVTLVCVLLGGVMARVEYLRRWAVFHEQESEKLYLEWEQDHSEEVGYSASAHFRVAVRFRKAMYRPWNIVDGSPGKRLHIDEERGIFEWRYGTWDGDRVVWRKIDQP